MPVTLRISDMQKDILTTEQKIRYVQDTLFVISGKWKLPILIAINQGNNRFRDISRSVKPITTKVLSKELRELEQNKLVIRKVYDTSPVLVEYTVSSYCKSLTPLVEEMIQWGKIIARKLKNNSSNWI
jgi:DNA-binding HxlR family transcriptional regulator